jgi:hypothetical protein
MIAPASLTTRATRAKDPRCRETRIRNVML